MRIVHVDETFHPSYGYQANPLAKFQQRQGNEVIIVTPVKEWIYLMYRDFGDDGSNLAEADREYQDSTGVRIIRVPAHGRIMGRLVYKKELFKVIDQLKPDAVFVHCVETLTAMRFLMRKQKYPMVFDSHMLPMASHNPLAKAYEVAYRLIFANIIKWKKYDVIRAQDDDYVNSHLGIPEKQAPFISFGTDTILFTPSKEVKERFRKEHEIPQDEFVVVYTGKLTEEKAGKLLAEAFQKKFSVPITLVCVGTPPNNEYGREVQRIFDNSENRIIMFPIQKYVDLAPFYQAADLSVFAKECSMSFYDAQACGLPVLSEDNNVNVDRCSHGNGMNFKAGSVEDFREKIIRFATMDKEQYRQMSRNAVNFIADGYDYTQIAQQYTDYLQKAVERFNKK